jgi:glycosyltransferase involved in cell wall biosynthesis
VRSVHITNYYHRDSGGISTSYNNLMAAAERHRREVALIVPGEGEGREDVNEFARIHYVPAKYSPLFDKRYRIMMPWQYMVKDSVIRRILLEERPDMIEVTDKYTLSLLGVMIRTNNFKKLGRPMLVHFSCERMDDNVGSFLTSGRLGKRFARSVMRNYTLPNFDFHLANSAYTAQEFFDAFGDGQRTWLLNKCWRFFAAPRVPLEDRIHVCPRGVDSERFTPDRLSAETAAEMRQRAGGPRDSTVLLYAGRISPEKNIGLLVEMMERLARTPEHKIYLLVAGAGPQSDWLAKQGERTAPGRIKLLGHLDKETLAGYYANANVFVHPNPKEPFGIAPLEAMASGVPTVAPNSGGVLSYANDRNAWLVEPTGEAFANAVLSILAEPEAAATKVDLAVETARENTRQAATDRLFATYDRIYEDFQRRRELFTSVADARSFDYGKLIGPSGAVPIAASNEK